MNNSHFLEPETFGYPKGTKQHEILRAIQLHGGITQQTTEREGFTSRGLPCAEMRELIMKRIVAPRILTSVPLTVVWQLKQTVFNRQIDDMILREASRLKIKEFAQDREGLRLDVRKELKRS